MQKALVIDDEPSMTEIIARFLEKNGFEVQTAKSGREGLATATAAPPDVAVVDVMMPDVDGYEVCRRLRRDPRTARSTIVVLTARGQPVDKGMAYQAGADLYLTKPFKSEALVQEIQQLLADRPVVKPTAGFQITILRLKEGVGATTLATNLALCLAQERGRLTAVADLVAEQGQVAARFGLQPTLPEDGIEVGDPDQVAAHLSRYGKGLYIFPSLRAEPWQPTEATDLLQTLRSWHDYVVVDTPRDLHDLVPALMTSSSLVLLLLTPDSATMRAARSSLAALGQLGRGPGAIWPVLTMVQPGKPLQLEQASQALGQQVVAALPWSPRECAEAVDKHTPVVLGNPRSALATAMQKLARQIVQAADAAAGGK